MKTIPIANQILVGDSTGELYKQENLDASAKNLSDQIEYLYSNNAFDSQIISKKVDLSRLRFNQLNNSKDFDPKKLEIETAYTINNLLKYLRQVNNISLKENKNLRWLAAKIAYTITVVNQTYGKEILSKTDLSKIPEYSIVRSKYQDQNMVNLVFLEGLINRNIFYDKTIVGQDINLVSQILLNFGDKLTATDKDLYIKRIIALNEIFKNADSSQSYSDFIQNKMEPKRNFLYGQMALYANSIPTSDLNKLYLELQQLVKINIKSESDSLISFNISFITNYLAFLNEYKKSSEEYESIRTDLLNEKKSIDSNGDLLFFYRK
jgi:hypothetical protein